MVNPKTYHAQKEAGLKMVQGMISSDMHRKFKVMAAADDATASQMLEILIENHWHDYFVKAATNGSL
jgi:hypothetical protein